MKEHKLRQSLYYCTADIDDINGVHVFIPVIQQSDAETIRSAVEYFTVEDAHTPFPAKSFAIAIIYARLLERYFQEDFYASLDDIDLLGGFDCHFVPYSRAEPVYNAIIAQIPDDVEAIHLSQVNITVQCFRDEFLLESMPLVRS